uniref:Uncharacterized protein n=1 Tax=Arundo donax TaxID=35708 RepID=A0A0A9E7A9_ARUDO
MITKATQLALNHQWSDHSGESRENLSKLEV